jgi:hypothetical protein
MPRCQSGRRPRRSLSVHCLNPRYLRIIPGTQARGPRARTCGFAGISASEGPQIYGDLVSRESRGVIARGCRFPSATRRSARTWAGMLVVVHSTSRASLPESVTRKGQRALRGRDAQRDPRLPRGGRRSGRPQRRAAQIFRADPRRATAVRRLPDDPRGRPAAAAFTTCSRAPSSCRLLLSPPGSATGARARRTASRRR